MNKPFPHFFALLSTLCISVPAYSAEGDWGEGTPLKRSSPSTEKKMPPSRDWSRASTTASSEPTSSLLPPSSPLKLDEPQAEIEKLRRENEDLRRTMAQLTQNADPRTGATLEKPFNPYKYPVLSLRWINLLNGYLDLTSDNYDTKNCQYYDLPPGFIPYLSTVIFPTKQPSSGSLKNQVGPELRAWASQTKKNREAYKASYQDWQTKHKSHMQKVSAGITHAIQELDTFTNSEPLTNAQNTDKISQKEDKKGAKKKEEALSQSQTDDEQAAQRIAEQAQRTYENLQKLALKLHPKACKIEGEERHIISFTPEEFERHFIWGFIEKPLATPYKTLPGQPYDPKNIKGFLLIDPIDIRIETHMLSRMISHLKCQYNILENILTYYHRDFVPKSTWRNWHDQSLVKTFINSLQTNLPIAHTSSIARFQEPTTDQEETLKILRRNNLGFQLRLKFLDHIKRYKEVEINDLDPFFKVYQGLDHVSETITQTPMTTNKAGEQRSFPHPVSTPFSSIQERFEPAPKDEDGLFEDAVVPFVIPRKAQMATEYVSPKTMGFHRNYWPSVMRELPPQQKTAPKPPSFGPDEVMKYANLYKEYDNLLKNLTSYIKSLEISASSFLPSPFDFFLVISTQPKDVKPKDIKPEAAIILREKSIDDQDLTHLRLLPGGKSEPVLYRYAHIDLAHNALQSPNSEAFGPNLTFLNVSNNHLSNLNFAVPLIELRELDVSGQILNELSPFGTEGIDPLPILDKFNLAHTGLTQINPLAGFSSLRFLNLSNNHIVTVAPLKDLETLEELNLAQNQITDITDLESLYNLRKLDVSLNPLKNLKSIIKLEALQILMANQCAFTGNWTTILPVATNDTDPHPMALTHLLLKGNQQLIWLPFEAKKISGSVDVKSNNSAFNISFPALKVLEVESNIKLEGTENKPIKLSNLGRR